MKDTKQIAVVGDYMDQNEDSIYIQTTMEQSMHQARYAMDLLKESATEAQEVVEGIRLKHLEREGKTHRPKVKRKPSVDPKRKRKLQKQSRKYNR